MEEFMAFPKIAQFKDVIRDVKYRAETLGYDENENRIVNHNPEYPKLKFVGTVKLHGTNAAVIKRGDNVWYQSRQRIITPISDNAGFATFATTTNDKFLEIFAHFESMKKDSNDAIQIFGEWCGGNIQDGVGLTGLKKMFVIFKIKIGEIWVDFETLKSDDFTNLIRGMNAENIFSIYQFPFFEAEIDFDKPTLVQNTLRDLTLAIEDECPVAKHFGVTGTGEGVVWSAIDPAFNESRFWFKVKGEKHSASKVKTIAAIDVEKVQSVSELLDSVVTENRLKQGISVLLENGLPVSQKSTGDYIKWVHNDIVTEELDRIVASGLEPKDLGKPVSERARKWFFNYINNM